MVEVRYLPGPDDGWRAAVSGAAFAALPPEVTPRTAEAVWRRLDGGGIGALLEALTGAFGTALTAIPPFALAVVEDGGVRIAVRGRIELVVEGEQGTQAVSGDGVSTWTERFLPAVRRVAFALSDAFDETASLPLADGVVPVSAISMTVTATAASTAPVVVASPAPVAPVEPAPVEPAPVDPAPVDPAQAEPAPPASTSDLGFELPELEEAPDALVTAVPLATAAVDAAGGDTWIPAATAAPAASAGDGADDEYVWGATVARSRPEGPTDAAGPAPAEPATVLGDHDGETVAVAQLRALRDAEQARFESTENIPPRRPARGRIRLSTGRVVELDRPVVIGRRPRSTRTTGAELPTLVAVDSPEQDISRNHVEIRAEGEHVLVTDLDTTNGTLLLRGGQDPTRLHPGEPTMVIGGDVLDLGDGVTVTFEDLP